MWRWEGTQRVILLACGSFNPPTLMHLRMMEVARDHLEKQLHCTVLEGLLSPVADSFNKPNLASAHHRLAMVEAATAHSKWLRADGWECRQKSWSRTVLVLQHHHQEARRKLQSEVRLVLVVGGDVVESFTRVLPSGDPLWHPSDVREIITKFGLIVIRREGADPVRALRSISCLRDVIDQVLILADDICPCSISSTNIRTAVSAGRSIMFTTPFAVIDYIQKAGLYTSNNRFT
uniref:Nicotinamide-nucleotide adenylyltransferase n=1 Tax=Angiostrongylus cantonensis TaxID=6313 RepID=A0A0K0CX34_ANGCA